MKTVLVTGGSRGIGLAICERFKTEGWHVAACATAIENLRDCPADFAFACDVTDAAAVRAGVAAVADRLGTIDVLVNNAGVAGSNPLDAGGSDALWHRIVDVNLHGTYYFSKHAFPHMPVGGRIVNLGSVLSLEGVADQTAYSAAKHAVLGFTRAFALHAARRGISVNVVCPGWVRTDMAHERWAELGIGEAEAAADMPQGRVTEPTEVAALVYRLASGDFGTLTGRAFAVDGGVLA